MKKIITTLLMLLLLVALCSCKGGNGDDIPSEINTVPLDNRPIECSELGISVYEVSTDKYYIADATRQKNGKGIMVRAFSKGSAVITVKDYWGRTATVNVTVGEDGEIGTCDVTPCGDTDGIDIRVYGAAGDGSKDDTKTVEAAIKSLGEKGGTIYFPAGIYKLDSITLHKNITLELQGKTENVMDGYTDELKAEVESGKEYAVLLNVSFCNHDKTGPGRNGEGNIKIHGGMIDLNGAIDGGTQIDTEQLGPKNRNVTGTCAMVFANASGLTIDNVIFKDCYNGHAFQLTGCSDVVIKDCLFAGYTIRSNSKGSKTDIETTRETIQVEYAHSGAIPPSYYDEGEYYFCKNVEITGCNFTKSDKAGYHLIPIGQHGMNGRPNCTGFKITNCNFDNPYMYGIRLLCYHDVEITGNTFSSLLKSTGFSPKASYMIYIPLITSDKTYSGKTETGRTTTVMFCNNWEQDGSKNIRIENNTFKIVKGSYFRVMYAVSPQLQLGAKTVTSQIRQQSGSIQGVSYTGYVQVANVIDGLSFSNNKIKYSGKPSYTDNFILAQHIRNFKYEGNTVTGYEEFTEKTGSVKGIKSLDIINGNDAKKRVISMENVSVYVCLTQPDGKTVNYSSANAKMTLNADDGVKSIEIRFKSNGDAVVKVFCNDGYTFAGWKQSNGKMLSETGNVRLSDSMTLTAVTTK